jgi:hypothetical protein
MTATQFFNLHHLFRRQNGPKPVKFHKIRCKSVITKKKIFFSKRITWHVLRSVCPNGSQKHMHLPCLTPHPKWLICLLPAKQSSFRAPTSTHGITWHVLRSVCPNGSQKTHAPSLFNSSSKMTNLSFTSKTVHLPIFYLCIRYIVVRL